MTTKRYLYIALAVELAALLLFFVVGVILPLGDWLFACVIGCLALGVCTATFAFRYGLFPKITLASLFVLCVIAVLQYVSFRSGSDAALMEAELQYVGDEH